MRALLAFFAVSCAIAPSMRSPLREALATADRPHLEQAATECLTAVGWKVDAIPGMMADADVFTGAKGDLRTKLYVHGRSMTPRLTGGPDDNDAFWPCLSSKLGPAVVGSAEAGSR